MNKIFYKNGEGRLDDDFVDVVVKSEKQMDGLVINTTERQPNPSPNTFGKYTEAVKYWTSRGLTPYDRGDYYEFAEPEPLPEPSEAEKAQAEISSLKSELESYDYIGTKIAMGVATREDYAEEIAHTEVLRKRINELEPIALKEEK